LLFSVIPGTPVIQVQPDQSVSDAGKTVNVTCNTTVGFPENTTIKIYRNDQIIAEKYGTRNGKNTEATVTIELVAGINSFRCQATNNLGGVIESSESTTPVNITARGNFNLYLIYYLILFLLMMFWCRFSENNCY